MSSDREFLNVLRGRGKLEKTAAADDTRAALGAGGVGATLGAISAHRKNRAYQKGSRWKREIRDIFKKKPKVRSVRRGAIGGAVAAGALGYGYSNFKKWMRGES